MAKTTSYLSGNRKHMEGRSGIIERRVKNSSNTIKTYSSKQKEWKAWCIDQDFPDGVIVSDEKLACFLKEFIMKRGRKYQKHKSGERSQPYSKETILVYMRAIMDLHYQQKVIGINTHATAKGPLVTAFLKTFDRLNIRNIDEPENNIRELLTNRELLHVCNHFLSNNQSSATQSRLFFLMSHSMLMKSEDVVNTQLSDLFSMNIENQGVSECIAVITTPNINNAIEGSVIQYGCAIRNKEVELCPINALALHLFTRFQIKEEAFPDFADRDYWYDTLLFSKSGRGPYTHEEYTRLMKKAFKKSGISTSKVKQLNKKCAASKRHSITSDQSIMLGDMDVDTIPECQISGLPVETMKILAGFNNQEDYCIDRASITPPKELQRLIFPEVEGWKDQFLNNEIQDDIAGRNFLDLLSYLRIALLQDSVYLRQKYPNHYLWTHPIFRSDLYLKYENQVSSPPSVNENEIIISPRLQLPMPDMILDMVPDVTSDMGQLIVSDMDNPVSSLASMMKIMNEHMITSFAQLKRENNELKNMLNLIIMTGSNTSNTIRPALIEDTKRPTRIRAGRSKPDFDDAPTYHMNRNLVTVCDVWKEYEEGLLGNPSIESLEQTYGTRWRRDRAVSRFFCRRNVIYTEIKKIAFDKDISCKEAARLLERKRIALRVTLNKLGTICSGI